MIPELAPVVEWSHVLEEMTASQAAFLFYERQEGQGMGSFLRQQELHSMALIIGPEGGFCKSEVLSAQEKGARVASLGPRVLRTETAAIAAATVCQMLSGDLDIQ